MLCTLEVYTVSVFFFSGEETLIMMTKDFDPISEFSCHSEEFGEGVYKISAALQFYFQTLPC